MTAVTSARFGEIVDRYSNPYLPDTAAARINRLLRNPSLSSDLVQNAIIDAICDVMRLHPDRVLTERYIAGIAKSIHLERIFQRELHIPATLLRAGDAYERLKGEMLAEGKTITSKMQDDVWDRAATMINDRQLEELASGMRRAVRILPLHDGRSPITGSPMPAGGLRRWQSALQQVSSSGLSAEANVDWAHDRSREWSEPEYFMVTDQFEPDADWLDDHQITEQMLWNLNDDEIEKAGFDPEELRDIARQSPNECEDNTDC